VIEAQRLTKRYGRTTAVDRAEFTVRAGRVTGFLGPNGAGKSTTMRLALGLDRPTAGTVTVNGRRYRDLARPLREVGALLDVRALHGRRSAYNHLLCLARSNDIPRRRVLDVIAQVGLETVADYPVRTFSLGMRQRLGIAGALLGDPGVLLLDEPAGGLDPEGVGWLRGLLRALAREGRTVFVSGHQMAEMAAVAEHLLLIDRGRILADTDLRRFVADNATGHIRIRSPQLESLAPALAQRGWRIKIVADESIQVFGARLGQVGEVAWESGAHVHELTEIRPSLEAAYLRLTSSNGDHQALPEHHRARAHAGAAAGGRP
jgi:ABC-2 type transport system ATP-binding protein